MADGNEYLVRYLDVRRGEEDVTDDPNAEAADGWELVAFVPHPAAASGAEVVIAVFGRDAGDGGELLDGEADGTA